MNIGQEAVVRIEKVVHGGQGLATLPDGQKVFVWGALPDEEVRVRIFRRKKGYAEALTEEVLQASENRITPRESGYLATSPWQIMAPEVEGEYKRQITAELFAHEHVSLPPSGLQLAKQATDDAHFFHYRNKMEYSFWGDEQGLHLALHKRGSHQKTVVQGSVLAMPALDASAQDVVRLLSKFGVRASELKTLILRSTQSGQVAASLFVKPQTFLKLTLPASLQGLRVYHSNPKSPASVSTKLLYELGNAQLQDTLLGQTFGYDADSFFQVNIPVFELVLERIRELCSDDDITDMYAGVGSIGLSIATGSVTLIELDAATAAMARINAAASKLDAKVVEAAAEAEPNNYIYCDGGTLIFDPPRAGLHKKIIEAVEAILPPKIVYLSCNPATQARDLALLQDSYDSIHAEVFNFFPRTPHIESLVVMERKSR